ncbi:MAG: hypothetical protein PHW79_02720 [Candidatus Marinimicrobia bacterium]|nr:hypothetical protein [Candidatus Neomarinimicrobiota bacterium]
MKIILCIFIVIILTAIIYGDILQENRTNTINVSPDDLFEEEIDPKLCNGYNYINFDGNSIYISPSVVVAGKVYFVLPTTEILLNGYHWFKCDLNGDGSWDNDWTALISLNSAILQQEYMKINDFGNSQIKTIKFIFGTLNLEDTKECSTELILLQTPNTSYGASFDFLAVYYSPDNVLDKPLLIVEGFDPLNENYPSYYLDLVKPLIYEDLDDYGYDFFFLNFADGGKDMRDNANVVLQALEKISSLYSNPDQKICIAGLSMGGVIARYALAYAEENDIDHNVGLFLSFDSPQKGAHISPDLQGWIKNQDDSNEAVKTMQHKVSSVAAQQLLMSNAYDPDHSEYNSFYNELNSLNGSGYPTSCYNVAISNGTLDATYGAADDGRHILTLTIADNLIKTVNAVAYDNHPGSMISDITTSMSGVTWILQIFGLGIGWDVDILFNPVFIPTWSALDLENWDVDGSYDLIEPISSKFDEILVQDEPVQHHILTIKSREKIIDWLEQGTVPIHFKNVHDGENIANTTLGVDGVNSSIPTNTEIYLNNQEDFTIRTNHHKITGQNLMHHNWNLDDSKHYLHTNLHVQRYITEQVANFSDYESVNITSNISSDIKFHDPWYLQNTEDTPINWVQPDCYRSISPGSYSVFLNQNDQFQPNKPIYSLKAPTTCADQSTIYVFDHWSSPSPEAAIFNNQGDITTAQYETPVVFKQAGVTVRAVYRPINLSDSPLTLGPNSNYKYLSIPTGANIQMPNDFKIIVEADDGDYENKGVLDLSLATETNPIIFHSVNANPSPGAWKGIEFRKKSLTTFNLEHVKVYDAEAGLCFTGNPADETYTYPKITHCDLPI